MFLEVEEGEITKGGILHASKFEKIKEEKIYARFNDMSRVHKWLPQKHGKGQIKSQQ